MIYQITFSPTGGTRKVADAVSAGIGTTTGTIELCVPAAQLLAVELTEEDVAISVCPGGARSIGKIMHGAIALAIKKGCAERKKNELFV